MAKYLDSDGLTRVWGKITARVDSLKAVATTEADGMMSSEDKTNLDACVDTKLSTTEKEWVESQLFNKLFVGTITANPSSHVFSGESKTVTFTLTTKYDGALVDLDSVPSGWTKTATGTYTKTATITSTTGSTVGSGAVTCVYNGNSKSAGNVNCSNVKYSYYYLSKETSLSAFPTSGLVQLSTSNSINGDKTIDVKEDGQYVYFIIANTSKLNNVQQLGLDYLQSKTGTSLVRTDYGTYTVFRSANSMAAGSQKVTIS